MSTSVASVTSHFPSAQDSFTTALASTISAGATSVQLNSVAGYNNGEVAVFVVDPATPAKKQAFTGIIDTAGIQVTNVIWTEGNNQTHTSGATVVDYETATHWSMVAKGIKVAHNQDGTHKSGATYPLPVIADFTNAQHNHSNAAGGGKLTSAGITSLDLSLTTLSNPYKFSATQTGAANTGNAVFATIAWDTKKFDTNNNLSAGVYTAPVSGFYQFSWGVQAQTVGNGTVIGSLYKGSTEIARGSRATTAGATILGSTGSILYQLTAGDTVMIKAYADATAALDVGATGFNYFSGFLVSNT